MPLEPKVESEGAETVMAAREALAYRNVLVVYQRALDHMLKHLETTDPLQLRDEIEERVPSVGSWPIWSDLYKARDAGQEARVELSSRLRDAIDKLNKAVHGEDVTIDPSTLGNITTQIRAYLTARAKAGSFAEDEKDTLR